MIAKAQGGHAAPLFLHILLSGIDVIGRENGLAFRILLAWLLGLRAWPAPCHQASLLPIPPWRGGAARPRARTSGSRRRPCAPPPAAPGEVRRGCRPGQAPRRPLRLPMAIMKVAPQAVEIAAALYLGVFSIASAAGSWAGGQTVDGFGLQATSGWQADWPLQHYCWLLVSA